MWPFPSAAGSWREAVGLHRLRREAAGFVIGACFLVRRSMFEELGGFDTRFWLYSEEADLCFRARRAGWRVELAGELDGPSRRRRQLSRPRAAGVRALRARRRHFVGKHEGPAALVSYRLANLVGAAIRSLAHPSSGASNPAPCSAPAVRRCSSCVRRPALRTRARRRRASGTGLVVCSLEPWDDVWRRNQFLVRELLDESRTGGCSSWSLRSTGSTRLVVAPDASASAGWARSRPTAASSASSRPRSGPGCSGACADRSLRRQVRRAARELGFVGADASGSTTPTTPASPPRPAGRRCTTSPTTGPRPATATAPRPAFVRTKPRLFEECRSVVVCSDGARRVTARRPDPDLVVIPNAVDVDHLTRPRPRPADLPDGPVAVYVGHAARGPPRRRPASSNSPPEPLGSPVVLVGPIALGARLGGAARRASTTCTCSASSLRRGTRATCSTPTW